MYSKVALGNVKKSFKDYSIYFLTLTLAVSIFYTFNSIESQKAILELNKSTADYIEILSQSINIISVFVSIILCSLILYANSFLIKKRKKELGIYMTLGMGKSKISKILIIETIIVGLVALISGLLLGFILSQGLSVFTSKLFDVGMSDYKFVLSLSAIAKTTIYFGVIFVIVIAFNSIIISKYKIVDLLTGSRKNEEMKFKNPIVYLITFTLCLMSLSMAYILILDVGITNIKEPKFYASIILGILGTLLFFYSLAGVFLFIFKINKNIYFKNLNIFVVKQLNSKINTNFLSISVICLMLFLTIGILSTGVSFKNAIEKNLKDTTPFDASGYMFINKDYKTKGIEQALNEINFKFDKSEKYMFYDLYKTRDTLGNIIYNGATEEQDKILKSFSDMNIDVLKLSDYNEIRSLKGEKPIKLRNNGILLMSDNNKMIKVLESFLKTNSTITLDDKNYNIENEKLIKEALRSSGFAENILTFIVTDNVVTNLEISSSNLNVNFNGNYKKSEKKFTNLFNNYLKGNISYDKGGFIVGGTKDYIYSTNKGDTTVILFIGIYLGIVFLISSMAVLSLQQLSEASDSIDRYKALRRIGANEKMINKTIFAQTSIYFSLPISLAMVHSIIGIKATNEFISIYNSPDIGIASMITALIFVAIYGGYFYATYTGYKNIVKNSK
ncbi:MAG: FtsX-like permease family protein [Romboutsia sp.]